MKETFFRNTIKWGDIALITACILETLMFPNTKNLLGCLMTAVSWLIFSRVFLKKHIILLHPFSFLVFFSMSMYRILPLYATLLERKPISYKFQNANETFMLEMLLYIISTLAFYFVVRKKPRNNIITRFLASFNFYKQPTPAILWFLGAFGLILSLYFLSAGPVEMGNAMGKFFIVFTLFQYAPLLLLFPALYSDSDVLYKKNIKVLVYFFFLIILSFSGNSRAALLEPIGTILLLFVLAFLKVPQQNQKKGKKIIIGGVLAMVFIMPVLTDVSDAMLLNREIRSDVSSSELFSRTLNTFLDKELLAREREERKAFSIGPDNYSEGWTEEYLDNFAFNRYCNMRITDITLYHAHKIGFNNQEMLDDWFNRILKTFPTPVLKALNINLDKTDLFSRGDLLYALSNKSEIFVGLRVTSHLADGLATFGYLYFFIQFILFLIEFKLLDCFVFIKDGRIIYSAYALICIFDYLGMFRNANGCIDEASYLIRGFIQSCFIFIVLYGVISKFSGKKR